MAVERYRTLIMDNARWEGFAHRPGDIVISTPAKCGTTWTQMLVALMVFDGPDFPAPLDLISPWLDMCNRTVDDVRHDLDAQTHRRFIKTHTPLDGLPLHEDVTYVVVGRDPRDVMVSMEHHRQNMDMDHFIELRAEVMGLDDVSELLRPGTGHCRRTSRWRRSCTATEFGSLASIVHHLDDAWARRATYDIVLVHYADLSTDLPGEMVRLADALGIPMSAEHASALAPYATLAAMRARAGDLAPVASHHNWKDTGAFFRRGTIGEGRATMTAAHAAEYDRRLRALAEPGIEAWIGQGRIASGVDPTAEPARLGRCGVERLEAQPRPHLGPPQRRVRLRWLAALPAGRRAGAR